MNNFVLYNPTKVIFGDNSMDKIAENIRPFGKKVLVTYGGGSIKKNGVYDKVMNQLKNFEVKEFGGIEPNPRVETIRKIISEFKAFEPDFVLAVGGGSVIDATKLLISSMYYDGDPWDFMIKIEVEPTKYVPFGTVLTISATGSEMDAGSVITNWTKNEKLSFHREKAFPTFSILDPRNTFSVPKDHTAYGIIDAFSHVFEQYIVTTKDTPLQDRFSESILLTLIENSKKVLENPQDYSARANITLSACIALNGTIGAGIDQDWATHQIEHEISGFYDIPHAAGLAIITPRWMNVVKGVKGDKIIQYGKRIWGLTGADSEILEMAISKTYDFFKSLGVKMSLSEWNIDDKHFEYISKRLAERKIGEIPLTEQEIKEILINCLK